MALPTTILNARVKQKIATDEYWRSIENELGIILEGEQAFVYNEDGVAVNFKIGDGTKLYSELPFFIAYFNNVTNCKVLSYIDQSANITIPAVFRNKTELAKIIFLNNSGAPLTLKIGTTNGGSEVAEMVIPNDIVSISLDAYFTTTETLYFTGLTGSDFSMFILYYQLDEAPVIPSGGSGSASYMWAAGTIYPFIPLYAGHTNASWDLITGLGKAGTPYEGAVLFDSATLPISVEEMYLRGYKVGDTVGGTVGANAKTITFANLPEMKVNVPSNVGGTPGGGGIMYNGANNNTVQLGVRDSVGNPYAGQTQFDITPKSKIVLYFTGLLTT